MMYGKAAVLGLLMTSGVLFGADFSPIKMELLCARRDGWELKVSERPVEVAAGVEEWKVSIDRATPAVPPKFDVRFFVPQVEMQHRWTYKSEHFRIGPDWSIGSDSTKSVLATGLPVYALFDDRNGNRMTLACSEAFRPVRFHAGILEEGSLLRVIFRFFESPEAPLTHWEATLRIDRRRVFWSTAVEEANAWLTKACGAKPQTAPTAAYEPLYSTWYNFHQDVTDREIEAECALAASLGMKTLIVDDGWQTDDTNRGYGFCGDWEVSPRRFPNMREHVAKVQAMGIKYMMWYSVPYMGKHAKNFARFKEKFLRVDGAAGVLDPRFPEVREYLAGVYEKAMREWNLDGFKLDFIDSMLVWDGQADPAVAENWKGRDFKTLHEATDCLMTNVTARLQAIKPNVLIEFRQNYIGPKIREYGNMMRASDCPGDMQGNRMRTLNLRLTSQGSAVHADMLEWHADESVETAARYVLNVIFSTVQYSVMLRRLPEGHREMIRHWVTFAKDHLETLQQGTIRPYFPQLGYPLVAAESARERIWCAYAPDLAVDVAADRPTYVLNATATDRLVVRLAEASVVELFDTCGRRVGERRLTAGLHDITVPESGYALFGRSAAR